MTLRFLNIASLLLIFALTFIIIILARQNAEMKATLDQMNGKDTISTLTVKLAGFTTEIEATPAVIFFLSSSCPHCQASIPAWNRLRQKAQEKGWKAMGVLLKGDDDDILELVNQGADFVVVTNALPEFASEYQINGVPVTILVNDGAIVGRWDGVVSSAVESEITRNLENQ